MSRIGAAPINIPADLSVEYNNGRVLIRSVRAEKRMLLISRKSSQSMEVQDGAGSVPPEGQEVSAHGPC